MKLYTEEQIIKAMDGFYDSDCTMRDVINRLTPIELPSDEEIEDKSIQKCFIESPYIQDVCEHYFQAGAKWMKEQILNQKNK